MRILIYGANGFTGRLILERCQESKITPIIAGRARDNIIELARDYGLEYRIFNLQDEVEIIGELRDIELVLHCAGPYEVTGEPMINACLATSTHYLDITGEISIFNYCQQISSQAEDQNVLLMPGCGFDIIPTENLVAMMYNQFPKANTLELGIYGLKKPSKGTVRSTISVISERCLVRENGELKQIPLGSATREFDFLNGKTSRGVAISIPDLIATYQSTTIENMSFYFSMKPIQIKLIKLSRPFAWFLRFKWVRRITQWTASIFTKNPSDQFRAEDPSYITAELSFGDNTLTGKMKTPNPYDLTADTTIRCLEKIVGMETIPKGFKVPSEVLEADFITECDNIEIQIDNK